MGRTLDLVKPVDYSHHYYLLCVVRKKKHLLEDLIFSMLLSSTCIFLIQARQFKPPLRHVHMTADIFVSGVICLIIG